ncbi:MAG: polysaccharide deacetylase family protein [Chloroflexota bacterium]
MTNDDFRWQLESLLARGYRCVSLVDAVRNGRTRQRNAFAITFDDGYRDNYLHAMPILKDLGLCATVFVTVDHIDTNRLYPWDEQEVDQWGGPADEDRSVTWEQLHEMRGTGIFSIGSHTSTHPNLAEVDPELANREVVQSKAALEEHLGEPVDLFCYPRGSLNRQVIRMARQAGYRAAVVSEGAWPRSSFTLPRTPVYGTTSREWFRRRVGPAYQGLLATGGLRYLQRARRVINSRRSVL